MSQYKVKLISLDKLPVGPMGVAQPLCNTCVTKDCSNPIEPMQVSIFGVMRDWKVYKKSASNTSMVVHCVGYNRDK